MDRKAMWKRRVSAKVLRELCVLPSDTFLAKGSANLDKLKNLCNEGKESPSALFQLYTQVHCYGHQTAFRENACRMWETAVLDITYFEENQLVDEDFPEESALPKLKELISVLSEPEDLVRECSIKEPLNILGAELLECLYWRKGALLYMYCHTAKERSEWVQENIATFKKCLHDGVQYLMKMLSFRCPLQLDEDISLQDKDTARLLSEGIFSDTHLLAMMYSGEMCYWGLKHCGEGEQESLESIDPVSNSDPGSRSQSISLDFQETGRNMLTKYVAIDLQLNIMSFLSPQDLCRLGSTSCYWRAAVQDPLLWRYFVLRDLPTWTSIDWKSLPDEEIFNKAFSEVSDNELYDYMAVYKRSCPEGRRSLKSIRPRYGTVTSFLQSLVTQAEPRFAMFGPGLEELDNSLVQKMMTCPEILLVAGLPQRQIHGIGSGVSFQFNNNQKFNIVTLYSTTSLPTISQKERRAGGGREKLNRFSGSAHFPVPFLHCVDFGDSPLAFPANLTTEISFSVERRRAREEQAVAVNKMFYQENSTAGNQQAMHYSVIAQVRKVCEVVDGFIYVANAEAHRAHDRQEELAHISAMIDPALGPPNRPLLVLSCVSDISVERIPCVYVAHQLQLNLLHQPWMMQDTVAATLDGLLNGIEWLLEEANCKSAQ
ncbi:hypothetical protein EK904_012544 [Melospiza melodia maxima]|nr:hypothetical protein EK904_012544 [Melospiza melodia maxima]